MQNIAAENNLSETAFVHTSNNNRIKFFTPELEVDLCGHATIASLGYLLRLYHDAFQRNKDLVMEVEQALAKLVDAGLVRITRAPLKAIARAMAKTMEENGGNFSRLQDLVRISVECRAVEWMGASIQALRRCERLKFTRAKDRVSLEGGFDSAAIGGYRDVMLNALLDGHLVEIQVHLDVFLKIKGSAIGHTVYKCARL